jgi:hypothetical protein
MTTYYTSSYFNTKVLEHVLMNTSFSASAAYLALFSGHPINAGLKGEISGNGYSRVQVAFTISGSVASNTSQINFPRATSMWADVAYCGIMDSITSASGNVLFWGELPVSKQPWTGDTFFINSGELRIGLGEGYSTYLAGKILNHTLNNTAYTSPGLDVFAALYNTVPNANDSGGTEVSASNYNRIRISGSSWMITIPPITFISTPAVSSVNTSFGIVVNRMAVSKIDLPYCTETTENWGTINGLCLRDSSSGGNQLFRGSFTYPPTIVIDDSYNIKTGELEVQIG